MKMVPAPNGIEPMMGPIQWTCLYVVNAMMYNPMRHSVRNPKQIWQRMMYRVTNLEARELHRLDP